MARSWCSRTCSGSPRGCRNSSSAMASLVPPSRPRLQPTRLTSARAPSPARSMSIRSGASRSRLVYQWVGGNGRDPALPCLCHIDRLIRLHDGGCVRARGGGGTCVSDIFHESGGDVGREECKTHGDTYEHEAST